MEALTTQEGSRNWANSAMGAYDAFAGWYDMMYRAQGRKPGSYRPEVVEAYASVFDRLGVKTILDCACGTGDPILGLAQLPQFEVTASDGSTAMVAFCARNALIEDRDTGKKAVQVRPWGTAFAPQSVELEKIDWFELPERCGERRFDLVMCPGHAIYHLVSRDAIISALQAMAAVTAPGGHVMFDTLRWTEDLRGEQDKGGKGKPEADVRFRGFVQSETDGRRLMFLSSAHYGSNSAAPCGVLQLKRFFVFEEAGGHLRELQSFDFYGAPFDETAARTMAGAAGLTDIEVLYTEAGAPNDLVTRYMTVIGRKPG